MNISEDLDTNHPPQPTTWVDVAGKYRSEFSPLLHPFVEAKLDEHGVGVPELLGEVATDAANEIDNIGQPESPPSPITGFKDRLHAHLEELRSPDRDHESAEGIDFFDYVDNVMHGGYEADELDECVNLITDIEEIQPRGSDDRGLIELLDRVPDDILRTYYFSDFSRRYGGLRDIFRSSLEDEKSSYVAGMLLERIYSTPSLLDLLDAGGEYRKDSIVTTYTRSELFGLDVFDEMFNRLKHNQPPPDETIEQGRERSRNIRDWTERYYSDILKLPNTLRDTMQFAAFGRTSDPTTGNVDQYSYQTMLDWVKFNTTVLGSQNIELLHERAGITNFDYYTADDLQRTLDLIDGVPETIERLQANDTTVVFTSAMGDYNGALNPNRSSSTIYDGNMANTIFFEIRQPSDFYRYGALLRARGIKPSTLVIANHAESGIQDFGKFILSNHSESEGNDLTEGGMPRMELADAAGISRFVDQYMQVSRGITDNPEHKGRKRLFLQGCKQATASDVWRLKPAPEYLPATVRRLYRRYTEAAKIYTSRSETMAETLAIRAASPDLDIYASPQITTTMPVPGGVRIMAESKIDPVSAEGLLPVSIVKTTLNSDGRIRQSRHKTLRLWHNDGVTHELAA